MAAVLAQALQEGMNALDNIAEHHFVNEAMIAWVDNMAARDERATEEGTFNNGRFEHPHPFGGTWYCCYTAAGVQAQGLELDPVN